MIKVNRHPSMQILRNSLVVFGSSLATLLVGAQFDYTVVLHQVWASFVISLGWAMIEFKKLYNIEFTGIKQRRGALPIMIW